MSVDKLKRWYASYSTLSWSLVALTLLVFVFLPSQVLMANLDFWNYDLMQLVPYLLLGVVLSGISLWWLKNKQLSWLVFIVMSLFWFILVSDMVSPVALPPLDGTVTSSAEPIDQTLIEILVITLVLFSIYVLRKKINLLVSFSLVLVTAFTMVNWVQFLLSNPVASRAEADAEIASTNLPNIYHIVLDEMQTDAAMIAIEQLGIADELTGFSLFENNRANYPYTHASYASFMTGTLFDPLEDFEEWHNSFDQEGLVPYLDEKGYQQWIYAAENKWIPNQADKATHLGEVKDQYVGAFFKQRRFLGLVLARIGPTFLTNEALNVGNILGELAQPELTNIIGHESLNPYLSLLMLDQLVKDENARPNHNQYVYYHATLPHAPYILSRDCELTKNENSTEVESYMSQVYCGLGRVVEFVNVLKSQGKYDESIIVIHADTGHGNQEYISLEDEVFESTQGQNTETVLDSNRTAGWIGSRSLALLMIKPPSTNDPFIISQTPTQLIDIFPSVKDLLGDAVVDETGESVFSIETDSDRDVAMFFWPSSLFPNKTIYKINFENYQFNVSPIEVPTQVEFIGN